MAKTKDSNTCQFTKMTINSITRATITFLLN